MTPRILSCLPAVLLVAALSGRAETVVLIEAGQPRQLTHDPGRWKTEGQAFVGGGKGSDLVCDLTLGPGDYHIKARLSIDALTGTAAAFQIGSNDYFGFEGGNRQVYTNGKLFGGGVRSYGPATDHITAGEPFLFEAVRTGDQARFLLNGVEMVAAKQEGRVDLLGFVPERATLRIYDFEVSGNIQDPPVGRGYTIPILDLSEQTHRQVVVDREPGQYLGHPSTILLEDQTTILVTYPTGHGRGRIILKKSTDGGLTWSERLPVPENWTAREVPVFFPVQYTDAAGDTKKRVQMISGVPRGEGGFRTAYLDLADDGTLEPSKEWTPLVDNFSGEKIFGWVAGSTMPRLRARNEAGEFYKDADDIWVMDNRWMMLFHDGSHNNWKTFLTFDEEGNEQWTRPEAYLGGAGKPAGLCEPCAVRSPDGTQLAILYRANRRKTNSFVVFTEDEGETFGEPIELPGALTGDRHAEVYAPDGRLFISFRDTCLRTPTKGDWVGWVGRWEDIVEGREGQYRVRLMDNKKGGDCAYPGVERLPDGTLVVTTYGHWAAGEAPYIMSVRFTLDELDEMASRLDVP